MRLGDRARDVEAEAGAGLRRRAADAPELLEHQPLVARRDPVAAIGDVDDDTAVHRGRPHLDQLPFRRVLDGVVDQVRQHLAQAHPVAPHER